MGKLVIYSLLLCLLIFSCKKEEAVKAVETSGKKYAVKFTTSGFGQTFEELAVKPAGVPAVPKSISVAPGQVGSIGEILYMVFNSNGEEIVRFRQRPNRLTDKYTPGKDDQVFDWPFGTITDSLLQGDYTIITLAGPADSFGLYRYSAPEDSTALGSLISAEFWYLGGSDSWSRATDTFYGRHTFRVLNQGTEQGLALKRIVGQIVVRLTDQLPANASYFRFFYIGEGEGLFLNDLGHFGPTNDEQFAPYIQIAAADPAKAGYEHSMFICNTTDSLDVVINCYDSEYKLIAKKLVPNVRAYKNKRTILTGRLFPPSPATSFTVSINDEWNPEEEEAAF